MSNQVRLRAPLPLRGRAPTIARCFARGTGYLLQAPCPRPVARLPFRPLVPQAPCCPVSRSYRHPRCIATSADESAPSAWECVAFGVARRRMRAEEA